jgi:hypothetical protein
MSDAIKVAIIGAIATILVAIIAGVVNWINIQPSTSAEATRVALEITRLANEIKTTQIPPLLPTVTQTPAQILTATSIPTTSSTATDNPIVPNGYILYDDFTDLSTLEKHWWFEDSHKLCTTFTVENGKLTFDCVNSETTDLPASLRIVTPYTTVHGIAALVKIDQSGGPFQLASGWKCTDGTERAYNMSLSDKYVEIYLYYPQEDWRNVLLTDPEFAVPGRAHLLQIESIPGNVQFIIDGKILPLKVSTDFAPCLQMRNISLDFMIWKDNNRLKGQVDTVSIKP